MTKTGYKILSGCLCAALICTITGASVHAENGALHAPQDTKAASAAAEERASKEETVYVIAGADGKQQSVIVSDWLENPNKETSLQDVSDLTDIENVKGDETWTANGTSLTWDAQGNDIYYQGQERNGAARDHEHQLPARRQGHCPGRAGGQERQGDHPLRL